jgi:hypothetical protein
MISNPLMKYFDEVKEQEEKFHIKYDDYTMYILRARDILLLEEIYDSGVYELPKIFRDKENDACDLAIKISSIRLLADKLIEDAWSKKAQTVNVTQRFRNLRETEDYKKVKREISINNLLD